MSIAPLSDYMDQVKELFAFQAEHPYLHVPDEPLSAKFKAIRHNYKVYQIAVDRGLASWNEMEPYEIADWARLFTPIEQWAWQDIRASGLPLWPQFPVGRFFVDFGNPEALVAIECDGKDFHDPDKDAIRDRELGKIGWTVFRVPGWRCLKSIERPEPGADDWEWDQYYRDKKEKTMAGVLAEVAPRFGFLRSGYRLP